jgi:hypothetical protein
MYVFKYLTTSSHRLCYLPTGWYLCRDELQRWNAPFNSVGFIHKWVITGCNNRLPMDGALVAVGPHSLWSCTLNSNKRTLELIRRQHRQFYAFCLIWQLYFTAWSNNVWLVIISITDAKVQIQRIPQRKSGVLLGLTNIHKAIKKEDFCLLWLHWFF